MAATSNKIANTQRIIAPVRKPFELFLLPDGRLEDTFLTLSSASSISAGLRDLTVFLTPDFAASDADIIFFF